MELNEYQASAQKHAFYRYADPLVYCVMALAGEVGELANKLKKSMRSGADRNMAVLMDELGDCLWYVSATAKELGYTLEEVAEFNLTKLAARVEKHVVVG